LKRAIQKYVEDELTTEIIENDPPEGTKFTVSYDAKKDVVVVKSRKPRKKK